MITRKCLFATAMFGLMVGLTPPATASTVTDLQSLAEDFIAKVGELELRIDDYASAREAEDAALDEVSLLNRRLDEILGSIDSSANELRRVERELARTREIYLAASTESAETRGAFYRSMTELEGLGQQLRDLGISATSDHEGVGGSWRVEVSPQDVIGLLTLEQSGAQVSGTYRLSNGARGTVRGSNSRGGTLRLQFFDTEQGIAADVRGSFDADAGEIVGDWNLQELSGGRPTSGGWQARRVSLEQVLTNRP